MWRDNSELTNPVTFCALALITVHASGPIAQPEALPALIGLVAHVVRFLDASGSQPAHRQGPNSIYAGHLRTILQHKLAILELGANSSMAMAAEPHVNNSLDFLQGELPTLDWLLGDPDGWLGNMQQNVDASMPGPPQMSRINGHLPTFANGPPQPGFAPAY